MPGPTRDARPSWPLAPLRSPGRGAAAARTRHPHKGTLLRPARLRSGSRGAAPGPTQSEHPQPRRPGAPRRIQGLQLGSAPPSIYLQHGAHPPLERQVSLAGERQAQLSQHPDAPKPCVAPAQLLPRWVLQPHAHACVCVCVWVGACVCACVDEGNVKRQQ